MDNSVKVDTQQLKFQIRLCAGVPDKNNHPLIAAVVIRKLGGSRAGNQTIRKSDRYLRAFGAWVVDFLDFP